VGHAGRPSRHTGIPLPPTPGRGIPVGRGEKGKCAETSEPALSSPRPTAASRRGPNPRPRPGPARVRSARGLASTRGGRAGECALRAGLGLRLPSRLRPRGGAGTKRRRRPGGRSAVAVAAGPGRTRGPRAPHLSSQKVQGECSGTPPGSGRSAESCCRPSGGSGVAEAAASRGPGGSRAPAGGAAAGGSTIFSALPAGPADA
jgi:hypothetical protein